MKALNTAAVIALFVLFGQTSFAQSNSIPQFSSDAEKQSWIDANPETYNSMLEQKGAEDTKVRSHQSHKDMKQTLSRAEMMQVAKRMPKTTPVSRVVSNERFKSEEEKKRWKDQQRK